ncbi:HAMP domain-containing protein [Turneriella parva]|uniref:Sensor with HAMP domain n=1 Tax=Turneriella parva (strain ATCC BAA-1111 / DSM 21527 / NCTC 11395 / H) TaxID=869212 RepID=I4BBZ3_TURPD|nr:HAMP domain-containing protein [Turneriella parva]AFM14800.1 putative sensor with HAMP domain [Turneriella parva DSM 21527]
MLKSLFNFRFRLTAAIFLVALGATVTGLVYYYIDAKRQIWSQMTNRVKDFGKIGITLFNAEDLKFLEKLDQNLNDPSRQRAPVPVSGVTLSALADEEKTKIIRTTPFQILVQKLRRLRYASGKIAVYESILHAGLQSTAEPQIHRVWVAGVKMHAFAPNYLRVLCADEFEEIDRNNNQRIDAEESIYHIGDVFNGRGLTGLGAAIGGELSVGSGYRTEDSGVYISGYTPLKNAKGNIIALLVIDFSAATEFDALFRLKVTGYYIIIAALLFSIMAAATTSRFLLKPLDIMQKAAVRIGQRDFSVRVSTQSRDELADLAYALNLMAQELGEYSTQMERRIAARTSEISGILEALEQGILTIDNRGLIQSEFSAATLRIFAADDLTNRKFSSLFENEKVSESVERFVALFFSRNDISAQMLEKANPLREIEYVNAAGQTKHLRFSFRPLYAEDATTVTRLLVSIVDDTDEAKLRERISLAETQQRSELDTLINLIRIPAPILEAFIEQQQAYLTAGKSLIMRFDALDNSEVKAFAQRVHALKGNAMQLGFSELADLLHRIEDHLEVMLGPAAYDKRFTRHDISQLLNRSEQLIVSRETLFSRIRQLISSADNQGTEGQLARLRAFWLSKIQERASLAGIGVAPEVSFVAGSERVIGQLHNVIVQLLRNTFAHGIESAAERQSRGKPKELTIRLIIARAMSGFTCTYYEDGRGFAQIPQGSTMTLAELLQKGLTGTQKSATLEAGRGIGMDYIASSIHNLRGDMRITSQNNSTIIHITLPD